MDHTFAVALQQRRQNRYFHRLRRRWGTTFAATVLVVVASAITVVEAFPGAAGACPANIAAVANEDRHGAAAAAIEQTFAQAGVTVTLHPPEIVAFRPSVVTLSSISPSSNTTFRGFLLRMESQDDDDLFTFEPLDGSTSMQDAVVCEEFGPTVTGLTHSFNDEKTIVAAEFIPSREGAFVLDVTVVESNNPQDGSRYGYQQLVLTAAASTNATTDGPPVQIGTEKPELVPTSGPTELPTAVPASVPIPVGAVPTISTFPPSITSGSSRANDNGSWLLYCTAVATFVVMSL